MSAKVDDSKKIDAHDLAEMLNHLIYELCPEAEVTAKPQNFTGGSLCYFVGLAVDENGRFVPSPAKSPAKKEL